MVLRKCLAGALAVTGALAAAGCTVTSGAPRPHLTPASSPVHAVVARSKARASGRVAMSPSGAAGQLVATGAELGDVMASEVSGPGRRAEPVKARPAPPPGRLRVSSGALPRRRIPRPRGLGTGRRLVRRARAGSGRASGRHPRRRTPGHHQR
ncbi:MAG: hypothetical protein ACRDYE_14475 [Acidimicrobiales bacterium]